MQLLKDLEGRFGLSLGENVSLASYCSYKLGGPAEYFCEPENVESLQAVLAACRELNIPVTVIGKGSNLLISDRGVRGMVICLSEKFSRQGFLARCPEPGAYPKLLASLSDEPQAAEDGNFYFLSEAGASLIDTAKRVSAEGLWGLEFACGIPGAVGGALYMNAGAYDGQTKDTAVVTYYLDKEYEIKEARGEEQAFGYRTSLFQQKGYIILGTCCCLKAGDPEAVGAAVADYQARRKKSQPLDLPSCGSVFKRPSGYYAGKLIMDSGLQGYRVGGAEVSTKHAGFIVNIGGATAADVNAVITHVRETVLEKYGVQLETEVRYIGEW